MSDRKIIHIDMDAFYASVEQRDNPELRGKPIAVGGSSKGRGVVAAASYEARRFGVSSAMASARAIRLCPDLIFVRPRMDVYRHLSRFIMSLLREYSDLVEPLSLDEAYLDVTENKKRIPSATQIAQLLRRDIFESTSLTASAGVAPNKFLAKIASDMNKPNGLAVIPPEHVAQFLEHLPVGKIPGVGKVTEEKMASLAIYTVKNLQEFSERELVSIFGKSGSWFYRIARGIDTRPVVVERERKSVSVESTFAEDITDLSWLEERLVDLVERLRRRLVTKGRTLVLKVTYSNFEKITRSKTVEDGFVNEDDFVPVFRELLRTTDAGARPIRLLGVGISNLLRDDTASNSHKAIQLRLAFP